MAVPNVVMRIVPAFVPEALIASNVGTWQTGQSLQHYIADETAAALFGLDASDTAEGLSLAVYSRAVHPDDRAGFRDRLSRVTEHGGLFVHEYRMVPREGVVRWVLARGRYERDPVTGEMRGRGILIDITDSKLDGLAEDRALFVKLDAGKHPLDRAAELAIKTREAIDEIEVHEKSVLRLAVDALLWALGRALARRTTSTLN